MRAATIPGLVTVAALVLGTTSAQAAPTSDEYVKYYVVTAAYAGSPENLTEIATRFLGSGSRSAEIFNLNVGREQPDGRALSDANRLTAGWMMVMPWDAVGSAIRYGELPSSTPSTPAPTKTPTSSPTKTPTKTPTTTPTTVPPYISAPQPVTPVQPGYLPGGTTAAGTPNTGSRPSGATPSGSAQPSAGACTVPASSTRLDWAARRLAADQAWPRTRGTNQVIAIVDSGADGTLPQLKGRIGVGRDLAGTTNRGDLDCIGTGTAMAALMVAQPTPGSELTGVAPDASVLPLRVRADAGVARPGIQAQAIEYAVSAGATVIALGPAVDAGAPEVTAAVKKAIEQDVVVVLGAPTTTDVSVPDAVPGLLRVAGVGEDMRAADAYRKGGIDLVAPGLQVTSLGTKDGVGSGTHYAVAFAAGQAALVRAAYPALTAAQVAHRMQVSADQIGEETQPSSEFGWGMLNPGAATTRELPEEGAAQPSPVGDAADGTAAADSGGHAGLVTVVLLIMLAALGYLGYRFWQRRRDAIFDVVPDPRPVAAPVVPPPAPRPPVETPRPKPAASGHWTD
ncbi:S8 family serine peptidase [Actinoplanes rectilineatus]|uniref:S8 family serine peptidase n=1 Tax=Actinoplanes rectilineatus TaxID=113571 RepID=UPI000697E75D|nr:S8 family serine peptidase [Actinoplanes rectilineatus]